MASPETGLQPRECAPPERRSRGRAAARGGADVVAFDITTDAGTTRVIVNLGQRDCPIRSGAEVLIASESAITDTVHTDHAVWLAIR